MKVRESEEMYLETILLLKKEKGVVRSIDIVERLDYAKSSVSRGVNLLVDNGYIILDRKSGEISFTESGLCKAANVYHRHTVLTKALEKLGADSNIAEDNACRIEHVLTEDMFHIIEQFVED